ncbi:dipeptide ABC transporter ATP-binding protein [Gryllotalpicola protaetiae]|uniref:ABC transporter ATP-binding protein n=1 Tax=Gryllotalpicola protaetiae TaxID=2419771 RepID=A0A387BSE1_9MICO|nr:ABC transporter ATP-binding protein [Gryllotalpicola protaetiae]AYG03970.1 ABC transporter ATP-binding protein [Gryllotalpicola protaetiae]
MTDAEAALLSVKNLRVAYEAGDRSVEAVRGVDFEVGRGEIVAIVGESGSGKTTTAQAVIHLLDPTARVTADELAFDGTELTKLSRGQWREVRGARIGLIPQDPVVSLDPVKKVGEQVAEALRVHKLAGRRAAAIRAVELLELAGLSQPALRAKQFPHQLSGGMKQRALIASALAPDPELIIADEPTSALDVTVQKQILDHLSSLVRERGTAVLLITHDLAVAADRADRILVMQGGEIVESGSAAQVLGAPRHPYTRALVAAAPALSGGRLQPSAQVRERAQADAAPVRPATTLLAAANLTKDFGSGRDRLRAVNEVSFDIARGETFALVGESGSGKSTTARLVARLETATAGAVALDGHDYTHARGEALRQLRRRLQLVYQNPYASLDPRFTVADAVDEPLRAFGTVREARAKRVAELIDLVALPASFATRRPAELSGGQRQRVAIARALALEPDLVVLDEAVSALDVSVQAQILQLLTDLQAELGLAYLFITHDLAVVRQIADRVGVMQGGRLVETGSATGILESPAVEYTQRLLEAIPGRDFA